MGSELISEPMIQIVQLWDLFCYIFDIIDEYTTF